MRVAERVEARQAWVFPGQPIDAFYKIQDRVRRNREYCSNRVPYLPVCTDGCSGARTGLGVPGFQTCASALHPLASPPHLIFTLSTPRQYLGLANSWVYQELKQRVPPSNQESQKSTKEHTGEAIQRSRYDAPLQPWLGTHLFLG
jgi:hypothetical protein